MKAEALTPADIFGYHVRYVVPLFQRPYVWNRQDQWEPLWADVRTVAERLLTTRARRRRTSSARSWWSRRRPWSAPSRRTT